MGRKLADLYPAKYLRARDIGPGKDVLTIEFINAETMRQNDGSVATKPVVYFKEKFGEQTKGLVLNKTNYNALLELFGEEVELDDLVGKKVKLTTVKVDVAGKTTSGVRIASDWVSDKRKK